MGLCQSCCGQPSWAYYRYRAPLCCGWCCPPPIEQGNEAKWNERVKHKHCYGLTLLPCYFLFGEPSEQSQLAWSLSELRASNPGGTWVTDHEAGVLECQPNTGSSLCAAAIGAVERGDSEALARLVSDSKSLDIFEEITTTTRRFQSERGVRQVSARFSF